MSVVGKVYGRTLIEKVKRITDVQMGEEQCGFRDGRGCVDLVFTLKILAEKFSEKKKDVIVYFLDLEKAYDRVQREKLWRKLESYGIKYLLLKTIKAFYKNNK